MTRLASMIIPLAAAAALIGGAAQAGDYYERTNAGHYKPADGAWYSSTCCYKRIIKHITITKAVWVKVPPPKPKPAPKPQALHYHHQMADDDAADTPAPAAQAEKKPQVVELGEVVKRGDKCRKPVQVRDGSTTIVVMVNTRCR
jgi:hypothetical protein